MIVTGWYNKVTGAYRMHAPEFPYLTTVYLGYTRKQMEQKYRKDHGLKGSTSNGLLCDRPQAGKEVKQ